MVGPEAEKTALVRHVCRMFVTAANIDIPYFTIVRKATASARRRWPAADSTRNLHHLRRPGEFRRHGSEGAVRLGCKELEAAADAVEREKLSVDGRQSYEVGKATNIASVLEIDQVIDPCRNTTLDHPRAGRPVRARNDRPQAAIRGHVVT